MREVTKAFIDALTKLESSGESGLLVQLFAKEAEIITPSAQLRGGETQAVCSFWENYRGSFNRISSRFLEVVEQEDTAFLQWVSEGTASDGPFQYDGVTVLKFRADKIVYFRSYFDAVHVRSKSTPERQNDSVSQAQAEAAENRKAGGYQ